MVRMAPGSVAEAAAGVSFASVEAHILARLPARMRDAGGPSSHPLLVVQDGAFEGSRKGHLPSPCMFRVVSGRQILNGLGARPDGVSTFQALNLDPGRLIHAGTHSLRLFNETEVAAGLSPDDRAVCANKGQNAVYDHEPPERL